MKKVRAVEMLFMFSSTSIAAKVRLKAYCVQSAFECGKAAPYKAILILFRQHIVILYICATQVRHQYPWGVLAQWLSFRG